MNKAIFLDRDGVLNRERGDYTYTFEDFTINDGVTEFLNDARNKKYLLIVISNQGGIGRNLYTKEIVEKLHQYMMDELKKHSIEFVEIYYCPHHPSVTKCLCRKPESMMLEKAIARFDIDIQNSFFIGDTERDCQAAAKVGLRAIRVEPNENLIRFCNII